MAGTHTAQRRHYSTMHGSAVKLGLLCLTVVVPRTVADTDNAPAKAQWSWSALGTSDKAFDGCREAETAMKANGRLPKNASLKPVIHPTSAGGHALRCACPLGTMCSGQRCRSAIDTSFSQPAIHAFTLPIDDAVCVPIPDYDGPDAEVAERSRRAKINRCIYEEGFGTDHCHCNVDLLHDMEGWLARHNISKFPLPGTMNVHGYWRGDVDKKAKDIRGLLDSFLSTNDASSVYNFWIEDVPRTDGVLKEYASNPRIQLRHVNLTDLAADTCLANRDDILRPQDGQFTQGYSDMIRLLILAKNGGMWADADSVFLRDLRPFMEVAGEFFSLQCSLTAIFNNNAMGIRRGSANAHTLLNVLCAMGPWPKDFGEYAAETLRSGGETTNMGLWYWNDGLLKSAVKHHNADPVRLPMSFFDPGWMCPASVPWSAGFASPTTEEELRHRQEMSRGAALLHTRATHDDFDNRVYTNDSYAGRIYGLARDRVANNVSGTPLGPLGLRTPEESADFEKWLNAYRIADPITKFVPKGHPVVLVLRGQGCLGWLPSGDTKLIMASSMCQPRQFPSIWVVAATKSSNTAGHYIRTGSWRINSCLTMRRDRDGFRVAADTCRGPDLSQGQHWQLAEDGTLRNTLDTFQTCARVGPKSSKSPEASIRMGACDDAALKITARRMPGALLKHLEAVWTERQFPEGMQHNVPPMKDLKDDEINPK
eukprot:m.75311 g.75311  ORF g.75311 m.75311 type:complete len:709 (+) comp8983_c1_seq1:295-2421(+)